MPNGVLRRTISMLGTVATASAVLAIAAGPPAFGQTAGFDDVPGDAYFSTPITDLSTSGVFGGTLCDEGFCPDEPMDRATMAVWTVRVLEGQDPIPLAESRFDDVDADSFYAPFIERMFQLEVTKGCGDGSRFCPDQIVSRAQMAVFLSRAYDLADGPDPGFADVPSEAWFAMDVAKLAASGITRGCGDGTNFCPDQDTTRGQMATFLHRGENRGETEEPTPTFKINPAMEGGGIIAASGFHACGIRTDQTLTCWPDTYYDGSTGEWAQWDVPPGTFIAVSAGGPDSWCGIRTDQTLTCWGDNYSGQTDAPPGTFIAVSAGGIHRCGIRTDQTLTCWGDNYSGQTDAPPGTFIAVSASGYHTCGIRTDQTLTCWGDTTYSDLVSGETVQWSAPTGRFTAVSGLCGIRTDQTLTCWGSNHYWDPATDDIVQWAIPTDMFVSISARGDSPCGIRTDQTLTCWGDTVIYDRESGQYVHSNVPTDEFLAVISATLEPLVEGESQPYACGIKTDQSIACWGWGARDTPEGRFGPS